MCPYVNFHPGKEADEENRMWQGCPSVAVTKGGRVYTAFYTGGVSEPCVRNFNLLYYSDDRGETWSRPLFTVGSEPEKRLRHIDIQLWISPENHLWVLWTDVSFREGGERPQSFRAPASALTNLFADPITATLMRCKNPDAENPVWEEPRTVSNGFIRNKPIVTRTGRIIFPAYDYNGKDYLLRLSDDGGDTFRDVWVAEKPKTPCFDEIMVYENGDRLRFMARTDIGCYLCADSFDDGETWTELREYEKAPSTRFYIGRLSSGRIVYIRSVSDTSRTGMKICLSDDGGETFPHTYTIDGRTDVSYPDLAEAADGTLYIVYDRERDNRIRLDTSAWHSDAAKEILFCRMTEKDILTGKPAENSAIARVISKARVDDAY